MKKRMLALLLAVLMLLGTLAGCTPKQGGTDLVPGTSGKDEPTQTQPQTSAKYAYKAEYLELDAEISGFSRYAQVGNDLFVISEAMFSAEETAEDGEFAEPVFETRLYKIDLSTGACEHQQWFSLLQVPEGSEGYAYVEYLAPTADGSLWIYDVCDSYTINLPENFNPETDYEWNYQVPNKTERRLQKFSAAGELLETVTVPDLGEDVYFELTLVDEKGQMYLNNWGESVQIYGKDGQHLKTIEFDANGGVLTTFCGKGAIETWGEEPTFRIIDPETLELGANVELPYSGHNYFASSDEEYDFYYLSNQNIYGYKSEEKMGEKIADWMDCDIDSNNLQQVMMLSDGRIAALMWEYDETQQRDEYSLVVLHRVDPSTLPVKTTLTMACLWLDWELRTKIIEFNRSSDQYRILLNEYSQYATADDYNAGLTKLNTEIISGKIPDLIYTAELPISQYAGQGLLEDLMPYLDSDPDLSADDLMQNVLEAVKIDGKLYQAFPEFSIETAAGLEKVVGEYDTWTLDDVHDALGKLPEGATIFDVGYTQESVLSSCVRRNLGSFINWQTGECSFDGEEFKTYLEFAKEFPKEFSWEDYDWEDYVDGNTALRNGKQLLIPVYLSNLENYLWMLAAVQDEIRFVGYPTQNGQGSCFTGINGVSITSTCKDKDGAWSFVRQFFTEDYQREREWYGLPSNANVFQERIDEAMTIEYELDADGNLVLDENGEQIVIPKAQYWSDSDEPYTIDAMTQEHLDTFMDLYNNVHTVYDSNEAVFEIINEESQYFFADQRSVDDVASMIQNRVSLYVAEQR